jgi:hypothetical protein
MRAAAQILPQANPPVAHRTSVGRPGNGAARQYRGTASIAIEGCRVLVAGRQPDLLLELAESLREIGCELLGPASCPSGAEDLLCQQRPNLALLDRSLGVEAVVPLATTLAAMAVPFAVLAGSQADPVLDHPSLRDAHRLSWRRFADELRPAVCRLYRADLEMRLAADDRQIAAARERLAAQIVLVERLAASGGDTLAAERMLRGIARSLRVMRAHRAWLLCRLTGERQHPDHVRLA